MFIASLNKVFTGIFGSRNERLIKSYHRRVAQINALEPQVRQLTDAQLRAKTQEFRESIQKGQRIGDLLPQALAVAREAMDRSVGIRNIFNPEYAFDPTTLPANLQPLYQQTQEQIAQLQPISVPGSGEVLIPGWQQIDIPVELYEAVRQLYPHSKPPFRARPFDVQLIGGMVLSEGKISEMKTGEGKTIVAPLACYLACLENLHCHIVTVNDYLVQRDRDWVFPFYYHLGLTVGAIHPFHMQPEPLKKIAYECDAVYGTNSEFGFDYLRDNMKLSTEEQVQKRREFCIIDEVDSILIDEARTPLIISGPAHDAAPRYDLADQLARHLMQKQRDWDAANEKVQAAITRIRGLEGDIRNSRDKDKSAAMRQEMQALQASLPAVEEARDQHTQYYEIEREKKAAHLSHEGIAEAQKIANVGSFYVGSNMDLPHLLENALRAHVIYQRDKDYVVQEGEVVIVDEFTGRLMIGRQWSDGLHQAVEAKEKVKIKQETQTLATITIQNFFRLYKRLAGMTGTAMTESTEFHDIYRLEVVAIPTNVPVVRVDLNDLIFTSHKDKWHAILEEIKNKHDLGQPVLVGTTSVENSEQLSQMLTRKLGIKHEVLNAKQHEREAHIVAHAGELGAVMIATNMAGRGTDIKLTAIDRATLIKHWQVRNLLPREAKADLSDDQLITLAYRHMAKTVLGKRPAEVDAMSDAAAKLAMLQRWVANHTFTDADRAASMDVDACMAALDKVPGFQLHRLQIYTHVGQMGGLHIVGTERHEARRIDNQLRGRSGRQGDRGSSRFFIGLEDDLMKIFAGKKTLALLSRFGMKEGDAIEHPMITRSVERAQRKVEERNYEIRKNLLEYDEVMEYQRNFFYGLRQNVLEERGIDRVIFDYIAESVQDAVVHFLDKEYAPEQIAEWCRQTLDVNIETHKLREPELADLQHSVFQATRDETIQVIELTIGEYMSPELTAQEWDLRGLAQWAMTRFSVDLKQNQLRTMTPQEVKEKLTQAALAQLENKDLSGLAKFLVPHYVHHELANWINTKFNLKIDGDQIAGIHSEMLPQHLLDQAHAAYRQREVLYPIEFVLEMVFQAAAQNSQWASEQLCAWANQRYEMNWEPAMIATMTGNQMHDQLAAAAKEWFEGPRMEQLVQNAIAQHGSDTTALAQWASQRFGRTVKPQELSDPATRQAVLVQHGRSMLRYELTQLERYVLLQILDTCWKDHLYAMDQLKDSIGLRSFAERDPRIEYKREGANLFRLMQRAVRDRVTDLIFRARLNAGPQQTRNVYQAQQTEHAEAASALSSMSAQQGSQEQQENMEAAQQAGGNEPSSAASRKDRRAAMRNREGGSKRNQFKDRRRR